MKNILIGFLGLLMLGFTTHSSDYKIASYLIQGNSKLGIKGTTNVSRFNCDLAFSDINTKVKTFYKREGNKIKFIDSQLELSNSCFDCGSKMINNDFLKMLDTKNHPNITLELKEITINPRETSEIIALTNINIAGVSRYYSIWLNVDKSKSLNATGCLSLKLSDFKLEPPKKVLGLVVVEDEIEIALDLNITALSK
ncbi:YceI family protein [Pontimicrobium aquaticum]|uniref:YceI family protein n=1 Tax=Pontimicrobium aquaticum TaxID=2565367 RepID=A0A4U0EWF1_9FLAO|nr:YceI family protein [Pontimicrobium aquaticum]TJY36245.1 YceI family protein [Pontimicrobium aquaticum]